MSYRNIIEKCRCSDKKRCILRLSSTAYSHKRGGETWNRQQLGPAIARDAAIIYQLMNWKFWETLNCAFFAAILKSNVWKFTIPGSKNPSHGYRWRAKQKFKAIRGHELKQSAVPLPIL